jgi:carbon-monoxide dehydrogenase catalytic subunit
MVAGMFLQTVLRGTSSHIGVTPKLGGSPYVINMLTKQMENITGSTLIIEIDPKESANAMISHIQKKRKALGI